MSSTSSACAPIRCSTCSRLTGDAVDNVPGVPKVGPKTAAKWLAEYGTLDNVIAHADKIGGVVGENLRAALSWLPQGRRLLTVKTDCELPLAPQELVDPLAGAPTGCASCTSASNSRAGSRTRRTTKPKVHRRPPRSEATPSSPRPPRAHRCPPAHYETILDERRVRALARGDLQRAELVCFDTETTRLDPMEARIVGLSFCDRTGARRVHSSDASLCGRAGAIAARRRAARG